MTFLEAIGYIIGAIANGIAFGVLPFLIVTVVALLLRLITSLGLKESFGRTLAFAYIGVFLGMFTGGSKEPVVAAMLPAAIGLISSITIYFFEKQQVENQKIGMAAVSAMLCGLVVSASFGSYYAANIRTLSLRKEQALALSGEVEKYEQMEIKVKLDQVETCVRMFGTRPDFQKSCLELLKVK